MDSSAAASIRDQHVADLQRRRAELREPRRVLVPRALSRRRRRDSHAGARAVYVKRVVGMPGERIEIVQGTVVVNGRPLIEPRVGRRARWNLAPVAVGADEFFVVGDNRSMKLEHHDLGRVHRGRIIGKLLF